MTEPTLTINRQLAKEAVEYLRASIHDSDSFHEKIYLRIIEQYLSLTDPIPLTAEHCREAGMTEDGVRCFDDGRVMADFFSDDHRMLIQSRPTVGQLRLALLQGNCDGERYLPALRG